MLTPHRRVFDGLPDGAFIIDPQELAGDGYEVRTDALGRAHFTAFWRTDQEWVPGGVRGQCFHANLDDWIERHRQLGRPVYVARPCSHPGCGQPTIEVHADEYPADMRVVRWKHLDPLHDRLDHVGYPLERTDPLAAVRP